MEEKALQFVDFVDKRLDKEIDIREPITLSALDVICGNLFNI